MEKNGRMKNILLAVLLVSVLTLSVAYALLSAQLTINSQATVKGAASWDVGFTAVSCEPDSGATNHGTITANPSFTNNAISGITATFLAPNDSVHCNITVSNNGTIPAKITAFTLGNTSLTYEGTGANPDTDEAAVTGKITYTLKYASDDPIAPGDNVAQNDTIAAKSGENATVRKMILTMTLGNMDALPTNDVTVSGFYTTMTYTQN